VPEAKELSVFVACLNPVEVRVVLYGCGSWPLAIGCWPYGYWRTAGVRSASSR